MEGPSWGAEGTSSSKEVLVAPPHREAAVITRSAASINCRQHMDTGCYDADAFKTYLL
jgi:hypothetical protein